MNFKLCSEKDLDNIEQLTLLFKNLGYDTDHSSLKRRLKSIINHDDYYLLLLKEDNQIIGLSGMCKMMFYEKDGFYMRILAFVIHSNFRGKGYGGQLLNESINLAEELGCRTITLNSGNRQERKQAHQLYESHGFMNKSQGFSKDLF